MLVTSKEANKLLVQITKDLESMLTKEELANSFLSAVGEDIENNRPDYDFIETQKAIENLEDKIRSLKHSINQFNISTLVKGTGKTIDELLVYIPQLTKRKNKLEKMINVLPKTREMVNMRSAIIDYRYINYNIDDVIKEYENVQEELTRMQILLDKTNIAEKFEIDI